MQWNAILCAGAVLAAGNLLAGEPTQEQIELQNQYVEYRLKQGDIYRIYVKKDNGVTTVQFPSAISEIAGKNVSADGQDADFLIQAQPGAYYFNLAALTPGATGTLTVTYNRKLYILYLIHSEREAYASVVFGNTAGRRDSADNIVTETPDVTPARLVSLIDMAKKFDVLTETCPEAVAGCERVRFRNRYCCGNYDIHLLDAVRFDKEDTVIFHVVLENLTDREIAYDKHSFSACAGNSIHYMSVSDASGLMPPRTKTHAWFGITSTPEGGRNNLKADNDWLLALTTREMHLEQLQSLEETVRHKEEAQKSERKHREEEREIVRLQRETAEKMKQKVRQQQISLESARESLEAEKMALQREKTRLREAARALKSAAAIERMCEDTRNVISAMRTQAAQTVSASPNRSAEDKTPDEAPEESSLMEAAHECQ